MKALVIYDTLHGNTEQIARSIGSGLGEDVRVVKTGEANPAELSGYDLLVVGSPTQGGRHTRPMQEFLAKIPDGGLKNVSVAAFDTRLKAAWVKLFGYAAGRIANTLQDKGGNLVTPAEPFWVKNTKGPLADGELERAGLWAKGIAVSKQ